MDKDKFDELIESEKQESKEDFLRFVTGIYNVDESIFDHIWKVPVIGRNDADTVVTTSLSTKTEDEILEIIDNMIEKQLEESGGCFIYLDKITDYLAPEEGEEWNQKVKSGEILSDKDAIIVCDDAEIYEGIKKDSKRLNLEELEKKYKSIIKEIITHERIHLNSNYLVDEFMINGYINNNGDDISEFVNGAEIVTSEVMDEGLSLKEWSDNNEVMVQATAMMIGNYEKGDTVEDCLHKVIKQRNGKSIYNDVNDVQILTLYSIFTEELAEWMIFGAYDNFRENKVKEKIKKICGTDEKLSNEAFKRKTLEYLDSAENDILSSKQKEMLEMLGYSISKKIDKEDMKEVATSEKALGALSGSLLDVKAFMQKIQKEDTIK